MSEFKRLAIPHAGHERRRTQYGYSAYWTQASKFELMNRLGEYEDTGFTPEEIRGMIRDEPRVMTLEEVKAFEWDYCYLEQVRQPGKEYRMIAGDYALACITWPCITSMRIEHGDSSYGVKWRCWTSRPTDEEREGTPWNGQS